MPMAKVFPGAWSSFEPRPSPVPAYAWHTSPRFGALAGLQRMQVDVRSLDPGRFSFPYHFHRAAEELFLVLSGEMTLRSPGGFTVLKAGDLVLFNEGPEGAHQLHNHGKDPCVYLDVSARAAVDVTEYPDSGKVAILPLGSDVYETSARVAYAKGEEDPARRWPKDRLAKA